MNRDEFGTDLFTNIEIPEEMKRKLYQNSKRGKRTADFRFRHAVALTAMLVALMIGSTGVFAKVCYDVIARRMMEMPETEVAQFEHEIENDTGITIDEAWSRKLTNEETLRLAELEQAYYGEGQFPEQEIQRVAALSEWDGQSVCYVEEDHLLHLPEPQMTDEQLMLFIDYSAKKEYLIEKDAEAYIEAEAEETGEAETASEAKDAAETQDSPYVEVTDISEEELIDIAYPHLVKFIGRELEPEWKASVEAFKPSAVDPELGTSHDMYTITWVKGKATPNGEEYIVVLGMDHLDFIVAAVAGREHWAKLGSYSTEDALAKAAVDREKVCAQIAELYGFTGEPDSVRTEVCDDYGGADDIRQVRYVMQYGSKTVDIDWDLSDEKLASVSIFNEEN